MIVRTVIEIHLKKGVTAKLLLTPALYGVAKERGIDLFTHTAGDTAQVFDQYAKIAYCAAISAWEVDAVDDLTKGPCPYTFQDFHTWAWTEQEEFGKTINAILAALTGKTVRDYIAEAKDDEKKKTGTKPVTRRPWIMVRSKSSS